MAEEEKQPENTKNTGRNPDGTWKPGFCPNPGGRKKNPLKEFSLKQFESWTDEQKQAFLEKVSPIDRWKMTEGNPVSDITSGGEKITNGLSPEQQAKLDKILLKENKMADEETKTADVVEPTTEEVATPTPEVAPEATETPTTDAPAEVVEPA